MSIYAKWIEEDGRYAFSREDNGGLEITKEQHAAIIAANVAGQKIIQGPDGYPATVLTEITAEWLCAQVDAAADAARHKVAGDPLRAIEYDRARIEAEQYQAEGFAGPVPPMVAAWVTPSRDAEAAALSILAEAEAYTAALTLLRTTRLQAKEQIRALMDVDQVEQAQQLAAQTVAAIEAAVAGVGNNA